MLYPEGLALSSCKDGYIDMYIDRKVASTPCKMYIDRIDRYLALLIIWPGHYWAGYLLVLHIDLLDVHLQG